MFVIAVRFLARPMGCFEQLWSCQSLLDKLSIRFAFGLELLSALRPNRGKVVQSPEFLRCPQCMLIGHLILV